MERAILITVDLGRRDGWSAEESAKELAELALSAGAVVIESVIANRHNIDPAYFIGSGKAAEIGRLCADSKANIVIFNSDLSGSQQKNLEELIKRKTIDRTQLILDIFAKHAHSNEGKVQVELAQLLYLLPRLTGKGIYLSRLGGGIGTRGPGEQKLEVDRRRIRTRITRLRRELEGLSKRRAMMRKKRSRFSMLTVAIIGYTNVGKSTLINSLTESDCIAEDKLFSTLDPTVRKFVLPNKQKILFVDTVGFLEHLPHHLIEAFKATLEEVAESDLLLHLVDASHPKAREQAAAVYKVLEELKIKDKPVITAVNKIDLVRDGSVVERLMADFADAIAISALRKTGFDELVRRLACHIQGLITDIKITLAADDVQTMNFIYENGLVTKKEYIDGSLYIEASLPIPAAEALKKDHGTIQ